MPPKAKHAGVRPHEMYKFDIAVFGGIPRLNVDTRYNHGFAPLADVVLTDIHVIHVVQESEIERAEIEYSRGVLVNLKINRNTG
jgi:hypothetical protein